MSDLVDPAVTEGSETPGPLLMEEKGDDVHFYTLMGYLLSLKVFQAVYRLKHFKTLFFFLLFLFIYFYLFASVFVWVFYAFCSFLKPPSLSFLVLFLRCRF